jgi:HlyD family type I secretion membrane fusion protein
MRSEDKPSKKARSGWWGPAALGYATILVSFVGGGAWSAYAKIDSAVLAPGVISIETNRKTVQHFEGGMVANINIREGQHVQQGEVLFELDRTEAYATLELLRSQLDSYLALEARLLAERDDLGVLVFPEELQQRAKSATAVRAMEDQQNQFRERRDALNGQVQILQSRIGQLKTEVGGLSQEEDATRRQLVAIEDELASKSELLEKKLIAKSQVLALDREKARLEGVVGRSIADRAKAMGAIGETELQIKQITRQFLEDVHARLQDVRQQEAEVRQKLSVAKDVYFRQAVVSPISGYVQNLKVFTVGAVIQPGQALVDVVPTDERLIIQARVSPLDIESLKASMSAEIRFPSFKAHELPVIFGQVTSVSTDRFVEEDSGQSYFLALIDVPPDQIKEFSKRLSAGMPAEIIVPTGERTALAYLLDPLIDRMRTGLREE